MDWVSRVREALADGLDPPPPDFIDYPSVEDLKPKKWKSVLVKAEF